MSCQHKWVLVPKHKLREAKYLCTECDADMSVEQYESVQQAHREGWEQAKTEAITITSRTNNRDFYMCQKEVRDAIAVMEYKEPT